MTRPTASEVLATRFISYTTPLELARRWSLSGEKPDRDESVKLLEGLFQKFPHSVEIGQQLALAYLEAGDESAAKTVLDDIQLLCRNPNEEVLSRCGRVYRDSGDRCVAYPVFAGPPEVKIGGPVDLPGEALRLYTLAWREYEKAFQIRSGHYPGVNVATLYLIIAAFETNESQRQQKLEASKGFAQKLLDHRSTWPRERNDDPIWHAASAGEMYLLLHDWEAARDCYCTAQRHTMFQSFHLTSMLKQVIRIIHCHNRLGVKNKGAFEDLSTVFSRS